MKTFCLIIRDLQEACGARDVPSQRTLDKALFCSGKALRWHVEHVRATTRKLGRAT
jgi:hypothetical protein